MCSFAGTGNVLKVQTLLHHCDEHIDKTKEEKDKKEEKKEEKKEAVEAVAQVLQMIEYGKMACRHTPASIC